MVALPTDVAGLLGWWDFSSPTTLYKDAGITNVSVDGDAIYQVNDKSGNGLNAVQAILASRPIYKTAIMGALSVGRFNGTVDFLSIADAAGFSPANNPITLFVVTPNADAGNTVIGKAANPYEWVYRRSTTVEQFQAFSAAGLSRCNTQLTSRPPSVGAIVYTDGVASQVYANGGTPAQSTVFANTTADTASVVTIGQRGDSLEFWAGDVAEIIFYRQALAPADLDAIGQYLAGKWGLSWVNTNLAGLAVDRGVSTNTVITRGGA